MGKVEGRTEDLLGGRGVACENADGVERVGVGDDAPAGDEAVRGLEADDAGVGGGKADGAAGVGSQSAKGERVSDGQASFREGRR